MNETDPHSLVAARGGETEKTPQFWKVVKERSEFRAVVNLSREEAHQRLVVAPEKVENDNRVFM